jgi:hypothetical protein
MFTTVSGYFIGTLSYGAAPKFALRTNKGEASICCKAAPPVMRENDIICVVLWKNEVVSISNFGTGTEIQYRVPTPAGPYWREEITFLHAWCLALLVLLMVCSAFFAGMFYDAKVFRDVPVPALLVMAGVTYAVFVWCIFHRAIVTQHNARITNEIHKRTMAASVEALNRN